MTRRSSLYIIDGATGTEGFVPEPESESVRNARRLLHAMAEDEAKREWRPSVPRWFPAFIVIAVTAASVGASLLLEWWLS